jgi:hypothetical protein
MGALADLLAPYQAAIEGTPTTPESLGLTGGNDQGMLAAVQAAQQAQGSPDAGPVPHYAGNGNRWADLAAQMAQRRYGWGPDQFDYLNQVAMRESGWNPNAVNESSGAYGIPQILPSAHPDSLGLNPREQIAWMLRYIKQRYGNPEGAWSHEQTAGWY